MPNPVTTGGRVRDIVLEVWAITVAATLAALLAAFFRARHVDHVTGAGGSRSRFSAHRSRPLNAAVTCGGAHGDRRPAGGEVPATATSRAD